MPKQKIVVLMGSISDMPFAHRISDFLRENRFPIQCEFRVGSAHRNPERLLEDLRAYEESGCNIVYITVAGMSDALSGMVAGCTSLPTLACPPDFKRYPLAKVFSSVVTPKGVAVSFVPEPENAALAAAKILALSDSSLKESVQKYMDTMREGVVKADLEVRKRKAHELEREHLQSVEHKLHGEHEEAESVESP